MLAVSYSGLLNFSAREPGALMGVVVKPVESRRERKTFLELPWQLYRGDRNWVPPLRMNQKELVGFARHPFYRDAEAQTFLAFRDGVPCGRVLAILNHAHNWQHNERRGFFGFFESVDDQQVANGLFDAVRAWFTERKINKLRGPTNPSLNYECGLLIEGFNLPPTFMMTYNPSYYPQLIERYGFEKAHDLYAFWSPTEKVYHLDEKLGFVAQHAAERFHVEIRPLDKSRFKQEIGTFLDIYNKSLGSTWGFVPLSQAEIEHVSASLKHLIIPELALMGVIDGQPIGAVFAIPDYNPRIKEINGRLFPFGFLKLLNKRRKFRRFRVISANVLPEYQKWGIGLVLLKGTIPKIVESGLEEVEFSWVLESNNLSRKTLEKGGALREKTYRIYDYPARAAGGESPAVSAAPAS